MHTLIENYVQFIYVLDIIENIEAEPGSGAEKMKIMYDSCVNLGKIEIY